ncbi:carbohydrate ABC transporter permease [Kribbella sp. NPDC026611]|uniref:carbohydrate ABC transporter permease n=1 Tax=Kribbella sp. NPDC026611 TaxID=3154911 RepID=UPI0033C55297
MTATVDTRPRQAPATPKSRRSARSSSPSRVLRRRISAGLLLVFSLIMLLPILMVLNVSLRPAGDTSTGALSLPSHLAWGNYADMFRRMNFLQSLSNTLTITLVSIVVVVLAGSAAAWAIARHGRTWTTFTYHVFVSGLTIPVFVLLTPLYLLMRQLTLLDTFPAVIIGNVALNLPFAVFFYSSFLRTVPTELEEAAAIDGCGVFRTYWSIVLPLLKPATATIAIFVSIGIWNDLVLPLLFLSSPSKTTITLSVYSFIGSQGRFKPAELFPAVALATIPLFLLFAVMQRRIVAGMTAGMGKR